MCNNSFYMFGSIRKYHWKNNKLWKTKIKLTLTHYTGILIFREVRWIFVILLGLPADFMTLLYLRHCETTIDCQDDYLIGVTQSKNSHHFTILPRCRKYGQNLSFLSYSTDWWLKCFYRTRSTRSRSHITCYNFIFSSWWTLMFNCIRICELTFPQHTTKMSN